MNSRLLLRLNTSPEQAERLCELQRVFAEACSSLGPVVQQTRCWNRVALHHLAYRALRERFPVLGSQMACNAIYSVSRAARLVFQSKGSPWSVDKAPTRPLPLLRFDASAPVYFDRHTLSIRKGRLSMYTLDGRIHFDLGLAESDSQRFQDEKLREIVLNRDADGFFLVIAFGEADGEDKPAEERPEYLLVLESEPQPATA